MQTQWTAGPGGAIGLNYLVLFAFMDRMHLTEAEYAELLDDVRRMELAALEEISQKESNV